MGGIHAEHHPLYDQFFNEAINELISEGIIKASNRDSQTLNDIYSLNLTINLLKLDEFAELKGKIKNAENTLKGNEGGG